VNESDTALKICAPEMRHEAVHLPIPAHGNEVHGME